MTLGIKTSEITARSSAEAEIYATDECVKALIRFIHIINNMNVHEVYIPDSKTIKIYNNNNTCVCWRKLTTIKCIRHITIHEHATIESVQDNTFSIHHIDRNINLADIFTKEFKKMNQFLSMRDIITCVPLTVCHSPSYSSSYLRGVLSVRCIDLFCV